MTNKIYKNALTRKPPRSMAKGITSQSAAVNFEKAEEQHQTYITHLERLGLHVLNLPAEEAFPDSHFVEDTTIVYDNVAILTRPGAEARRGEVACIKHHLQSLFTVEELGGGDEALVDGGDVLITGNKVLIGIYDRTNLAGGKRLKDILHTVNKNLEIHFIEFSGVLHLKSGLTALNENLLIGNPLLKLATPIDFLDVHWLPVKEAYAANTLTVNSNTFHFAEAKNVKEIITKAGNTPIPVELSEFKKMDGSFTCLSLLW